MPRELPRRYTPDELDAITASLRPHTVDTRNIERLQQAAERYQWARLSDEKNVLKHFPSSTNRGRRSQFKLIIELCERGASESEIEIALNGLDGWASQLLGTAGTNDRSKLKEAAELALTKISARGPNPKRGRRQFIGDLAKIFLQITRKRPGRSVHDQEGGLFLAFVKTALRPFGAEQGCEADIKAKLAQMKERKRSRAHKK